MDRQFNSPRNNYIDLFYVIVHFLHQLPGKVDPRLYQQNRDNAAARMRKYKCLKNANAEASAKESNTVRLMTSYPGVLEWVVH